MPTLTKLDPKTTAVLTLDCQNGIFGMIAAAARILAPAARVLAAARARGIPVLHVGLGFRPGYPEVQPDHPIFATLRQTGKFVVGSDSAAFHEAVAPLDGETTIVKHRVSAFSGNDLEMILRAQRIQTLVLFGISTSGIVLSTVRLASDLDFHVVVVEDCCFDPDEEVHRVLTGKIFVRQAAVGTAEAVIQALAG